jgi:hypothetical protein
MTTGVWKTGGYFLAFPKAEGFSIHAKEEKYYRLISKKFQKKKDLLGFSQKNPSFG